MAPYAYDAADLLHLGKKRHHLFQGVWLIPAVIIGISNNIPTNVGEKCIARSRNTLRWNYNVTYLQLAFIAIQGNRPDNPTFSGERSSSRHQ